jgi:hypothetical protein
LNFVELGLFLGQQPKNGSALGVVNILVQEPLVVFDVQPGDRFVHEPQPCYSCPHAILSIGQATGKQNV